MSKNSFTVIYYLRLDWEHNDCVNTEHGIIIVILKLSNPVFVALITLAQVTFLNFSAILVFKARESGLKPGGLSKSQPLRLAMSCSGILSSDNWLRVWKEEHPA